jgi:hypothetical protein
MKQLEEGMVKLSVLSIRDIIFPDAATVPLPEVVNW